MDKIFVLDKKYFVIDKIILSRTNMILSRTNMILSKTKNILSGQMDRALVINTKIVIWYVFKSQKTSSKCFNFFATTAIFKIKERENRSKNWCFKAHFLSILCLQSLGQKNKIVEQILINVALVPIKHSNRYNFLCFCQYYCFLCF